MRAILSISRRCGFTDSRAHRASAGHIKRGISLTEQLAQLKAAGFLEVGHWELDSNRQPRFVGQAPGEPGVYAIIVNGGVCYIGCAQRGIHRRFRKYNNPDNKGAVAIRVRGYITEALSSDAKVNVLALKTISEPVPWNGLPLDLIAGLEEGLIRQMQPAWNRRGLAALRKIALLNSN